MASLAKRLISSTLRNHTTITVGSASGLGAGVLIVGVRLTNGLMISGFLSHVVPDPVSVGVSAAPVSDSELAAMLALDPCLRRENRSAILSFGAAVTDSIGSSGCSLLSDFSLPLGPRNEKSGLLIHVRGLLDSAASVGPSGSVSALLLLLELRKLENESNSGLLIQVNGLSFCTGAAVGVVGPVKALKAFSNFMEGPPGMPHLSISTRVTSINVRNYQAETTSLL